MRPRTVKLVRFHRNSTGCGKLDPGGGGRQCSGRQTYSLRLGASYSTPIRARNPSAMVGLKKELFLRYPWPTNPRRRILPRACSRLQIPQTYPVETPPDDESCRNACRMQEGFTRENIFELLGKLLFQEAKTLGIKELASFP